MTGDFIFMHYSKFMFIIQVEKFSPPFWVLLVSEIVLVICKISSTFSVPCKKSPLSAFRLLI
jgi:hypothetical protein